MKKILKLLMVAYVLLGGAAMAQTQIKAQANTKTQTKSESWDKTFAKSERVEVQKVSFKNRYGIALVGDLYIPKTLLKDSKNAKLPAIAISGPFGAVKEQASGLYAQNLAERGFITLAFDPSFTGESALANKTLPQSVASPDINTEDFSAAVDFLANHTKVDSNKIGILGICGFGGFAINAAAMDTRIKATITSTMYDMTRISAKGYDDKQDSKEERKKLKEALNAQRTEDFKNGSFAKAGGLPDSLRGDEPQFIKDYFNYYKNKDRGFHPRSINSTGGWNLTSSLSLINMPILAYADEIDSAVLVIHGERAHSRYFSEDAFKKLKGKNKELLIIEGANHTDLYDNVEKIPFDKMVEFLRENL